jgi:hypothetical protein
MRLHPLGLQKGKIEGRVGSHNAEPSSTRDIQRSTSLGDMPICDDVAGIADKET